MAARSNRRKLSVSASDFEGESLFGNPAADESSAGEAVGAGNGDAAGSAGKGRASAGRGRDGRSRKRSGESEAAGADILADALGNGDQAGGGSGNDSGSGSGSGGSGGGSGGASGGGFGDGGNTSGAGGDASGGGGDASGGGGDTSGGGGDTSGGGGALHELARVRYLNYAMSVITSRALPDVRDGLKPVQRRILFTMWKQNLTFSAKHRKCAKVVGDVMGRYHPHGDSAIYETLVRMAQPFSMRTPLIDGSGNFGSLDGDSPAAMRYTECRLAAISEELLDELDHDTVHFRPNYDETATEPVVLPTRLPNLLINGATGIAVGMATNIPPHHPGEVCQALLKLLDNPELKAAQLVGRSAIQGPDFPTGGHILNTQDELKEIYKTGSGSIRVRCTTEPGESRRGSKSVFITSIPYMINKATLVEQIAQVILSRKLPPLLDVRDLSTDDVRIQLDLKKDVDEGKVLAYLFKHTDMQSTFAVNLTCLLPTERPEIGRPQRCDLREVLQHFLKFRLEVVTRRLEHERAVLARRIHILDGFALIFDALDEILRIIRRSDGKADAAARIMKRFDQLDAEQTDAILELKLYRLAKLEINLIRQELAEKQKLLDRIQGLLGDEASRWKLVGDEIRRMRDKYGKTDKRRTIIDAPGEEPEFSAEDFIVDEDHHVLVTRDGWVKRQKEIKDPAGTRLREGDSILAVMAGSTRATCVFFSNFGVAYTARISELPLTTGYGEPIQKTFKLKDGERIVAAMSLDARVTGPLAASDGDGSDGAAHVLAATSDGYALRFSLQPYLEPSTRSGRRYARPSGKAQVVGVDRVDHEATILAVTRQARAMVCSTHEINFLAGPGRGVILIKLSADDAVIGFRTATNDRQTLTVKTSNGGEQRINTGRYELTSRGGKGREIIKRGHITSVVVEDPVAPLL